MDRAHFIAFCRNCYVLDHRITEEDCANLFDEQFGEQKIIFAQFDGMLHQIAKKKGLAHQQMMDLILGLAANELGCGALLIKCQGLFPSWADVSRSEFSVEFMVGHAGQAQIKLRAIRREPPVLLMNIDADGTVEKSFKQLLLSVLGEMGVGPIVYCCNAPYPGITATESLNGGHAEIDCRLDADTCYTVGILIGRLHSLNVTNSWMQPHMTADASLSRVHMLEVDAGTPLSIAWPLTEDLQQFCALDVNGFCRLQLLSMLTLAESKYADRVDMQWIRRYRQLIPVIIHLTPDTFMGRLVLSHTDLHRFNIVRQSPNDNNWRLLDFDGCCLMPAAVDLGAFLCEIHKPEEGIPYPSRENRMKLLQGYCLAAGECPDGGYRRGMDDMLFDIERGWAIRALWMSLFMLCANGNASKEHWENSYILLQQCADVFERATEDAVLYEDVLSDGILKVCNGDAPVPWACFFTKFYHHHE